MMLDLSYINENLTIDVINHKTISIQSYVTQVSTAVVSVYGSFNNFPRIYNLLGTLDLDGTINTFDVADYPYIVLVVTTADNNGAATKVYAKFNYVRKNKIHDASYNLSVIDLEFVGVVGTIPTPHELTTYATESFSDASGIDVSIRDSQIDGWENANTSLVINASNVTRIDSEKTSSFILRNNAAQANKLNVWSYSRSPIVYEELLDILVAGANVTLTPSLLDKSITIASTASGGGGSSTLSGLSDTTIVTPINGNILGYNSGAWRNRTLAAAGISAVGHTHTESQITDLQDYLLDLSGLTTNDLAEGSNNLYFTNSRVDTRVGNLLIGGDNITLTSGTGSITISTTAPPTLDGLTDVDISSLASGNILGYNGTDWVNRTLSAAGISAVGHTHSASDIVVGTLPIIRGGTGSTALPFVSNYTGGSSYSSNLSGIDTALGLRSLTSHTHAASAIISGQFADARISTTSVIQHEAGLTITESQISDLGTYYKSGDSIVVALGTAAAPGISFAGGSNTGIFSLGNDRMSFVTNGTTVGDVQTFFGASFVTWSGNTQTFTASQFFNVNSPALSVRSLTPSLAGVLRLFEGSANGTNSISVRSPASLASDWTLTLPTNDGDNNQFLLTDGSGVTSWNTITESVLPATITAKLNVVKLSYLIGTPSNKDYVVELHIPFVSTLETIHAETASGTCTLNVKINTTSVTGWSALAVTSTPSTATATAANVTAVGNRLVLTISASSTPVDLAVTILGTL